MKQINIIKKISLVALLSFVFSFSVLFAQNDTLYIMKNGAVIAQYDVNTEIDSIIFYKPIIEPTSGSFFDGRDGNEYKWVKIGNQVWMAENLKYLPSVVEPGIGSNYAAYYYVYGYDGTNVNDAKATDNYETYGVLYNWTAAQTACPTGWHLPSDAEWTQLTDFVGGAENAGTLLKSQTGWNNDGNGTDQYGFTALPGGNRGTNGSFYDFGYFGYWWSSTEYDTNSAWYRYMYYNNSYSYVYRDNDYKLVGFSVRCVRD